MRIVPRLVPVAVEKRTATRKASRTKPPPLTPNSAPAHTREWTSPDSRSTAEKMPASSQAATMSMTMGRDIPRRAAAL